MSISVGPRAGCQPGIGTAIMGIGLASYWLSAVGIGRLSLSLSVAVSLSGIAPMMIDLTAGATRGAWWVLLAQPDVTRHIDSIELGAAFPR